MDGAPAPACLPYQSQARIPRRARCSRVFLTELGFRPGAAQAPILGTSLARSDRVGGVNDARLDQAEYRRVQAERTMILIEQLRGHLAGRSSRADLAAWIRGLGRPVYGQQGPFRWHPACCVFDSLQALELFRGDVPWIREVDLRAYLRWLREGDDLVFFEEAPLITLKRDIDAFATETGTEAIRWFNDMTGLESKLFWWVSTRFAAPPRGRPFYAHGLLEEPGIVDVWKLRSDDWNEAIVDLFEMLAIDDADAVRIDPRVELAKLPVWALWRRDDNNNSFEMARFRSYAKAGAQAQMYTARGHRQTYWVDAA